MSLKSSTTTLTEQIGLRSNNKLREMIELRFDADERNAAREIGIAPDTLKAMRIRGDIPPHCYTKFSYKLLRYCLPLLRDWQLDPTDLAAQARAMEQLQNSRVSNLPTKKGRKAA